MGWQQMHVDRLEELARLVRWTGLGPSGIDWAQVEHEVGIHIPSSYKEYAGRFPPGVFQHYLEVEQPRGPQDYLRYADSTSDLLKTLRVAKHYSSTFAHGVFPQLPGLFPWGYIGSEYIFCWHIVEPTDDSPTIVVVNLHEHRALEFGESIADCVFDVITGRVPEFAFVADECSPPRFDALKLPQRGPRSLRRVRDFEGIDPEGILTVAAPRVDAVDDILHLVERPRPVPAPDWAALERQLRHPLPSDYTRLIEQVGPGRYGDIVVADPTGSLGDIPSLLSLTEVTLGALNRETTESNYEGPVVWGSAPNGWFCGWVPGDYPAGRRPLLLFSLSTAEREGHGASMTSYLASHLRAPTDWETAPWRVGEPE